MYYQKGYGVAQPTLDDWKERLPKFKDTLSEDAYASLEKAAEIVTKNKVSVLFYDNFGHFSANCVDSQNCAADIGIGEIKDGKDFSQKFLDGLQKFDIFESAAQYGAVLQETEARWKDGEAFVDGKPISEIHDEILYNNGLSQKRFLETYNQLAEVFGLEKVNKLTDLQSDVVDYTDTFGKNRETFTFNYHGHEYPDCFVVEKEGVNRVENRYDIYNTSGEAIITLNSLGVIPNSLAYQGISDDDVKDYCKDVIAVKATFGQEDLLDWMQEAGVVKEFITYQKQGFVNFPIVQIDREKLLNLSDKKVNTFTTERDDNVQLDMSDVSKKVNSRKPNAL